MKIPEGKEMVQSIGFLPKEIYLELNGNITKNIIPKDSRIYLQQIEVSLQLS